MQSSKEYLDKGKELFVKAGLSQDSVYTLLAKTSININSNWSNVNYTLESLAYLKRALELNPGNQEAKEALTKVEEKATPTLQDILPNLCK